MVEIAYFAVILKDMEWTASPCMGGVYGDGLCALIIRYM